MAKSQTYSVPEVKEIQTHLGILLHHFQLSGKSTHLLNKALSNLKMKKIHVVTWCQMRMSYVISEWKLTVENWVAICDVLVNADIKKKERAYIIGSQSMIIFHILGDLESESGKFHLRKFDNDDTLINEAYYASIKFAVNLKIKFKTILLMKFLDDLEKGEHGNLICNLKTTSGNQHPIKLIYSHCPVRLQ